MITVSTWKDWVLRNQLAGNIPNFFVSYPYLKLSKAQVCSTRSWMWVEADGVCLFPPVPIAGHANLSDFPEDFVWSDFPNTDLKPDFASEPLDHEFIYDPKNFDESRMTGGKWSVFRKNARKWPRSNSEFKIVATAAPDGKNLQVMSLVADWLERKEEDAEDPELIVGFTVNPVPGVGHLYILDDRDRLAAIAVWDMNWKYVNFRFLIVRKEEPFLDEFARKTFFQFCNSTFPWYLVNDGGSLGREGLEKFKDKLQPVSKRLVYSWRRK